MEYIPKYGSARIESKDAEGISIVFNGLEEAVKYWGMWIKEQAEKELALIYPSNIQPMSAYSPKIDPVRNIDGEKWEFVSVAEEKTIAYLWSRTITCEGPGCGAEVPLIRSLWLVKKRDRSVALQIIPDKQNKKVDFEIIEKINSKWVKQAGISLEGTKPNFDGTIRKGSATCPVCGYTTPIERIRLQLKLKHGGTSDARLIALVCSIKTKRKNTISKENVYEEIGKFYRTPTNVDQKANDLAIRLLESKPTNLIPTELIPINEIRRISIIIYGMEKWGEMFTPRQLLSLVTLTQLINKINQKFKLLENDENRAILTILSLS